MTTQFYDMLKHNFRHQARLKKLCEPLKTYFGLDVFFQYNISPDGSFTNLGNVPDNASYHYEGGVYSMNPLFTHPKNFTSGCLLLEREPDWERVHQKMQPLHSLHHLLVVIRKEEEQMSGFGFASSQYKPRLCSVYLNKLPLLNRFIDYWVEETEDIQRKLQDDAVNMCDLRGKLHFLDKTKCFYQNSREEDLQFLRNLKIDENLLDSWKLLTPREREVFHHCIQGETAAETALKLCISRRTVEHFLDEIKAKFGGMSKSELRTIGQKLIPLIQ